MGRGTRPETGEIKGATGKVTRRETGEVVGPGGIEGGNEETREGGGGAGRGGGGGGGGALGGRVGEVVTEGEGEVDPVYDTIESDRCNEMPALADEATGPRVKSGGGMGEEAALLEAEELSEAATEGARGGRAAPARSEELIVEADDEEDEEVERESETEEEDCMEEAEGGELGDCQEVWSGTCPVMFMVTLVVVMERPVAVLETAAAVKAVAAVEKRGLTEAAWKLSLSACRVRTPNATSSSSSG